MMRMIKMMKKLAFSDSPPVLGGVPRFEVGWLARGKGTDKKT